MYRWTAFDDGTGYGGEIQYSVGGCGEYVCVPRYVHTQLRMSVCMCVCINCFPKDSQFPMVVKLLETARPLAHRCSP